MAIVRVTPEAQYVLHLSEVDSSRGRSFTTGWINARTYRRNRRNRKTRYRAQQVQEPDPGRRLVAAEPELTGG